MSGSTAFRLFLAGVSTLITALPASAQQPVPGLRSSPGPAQFRPATPAPHAPSAPAPVTAGDAQAALEAARVAWEAMPLPDRLAVQEGLIWAGDYTGSIDGTFGRMSYEALTAFQARRKLTPDGQVTPVLRAALDEGAVKRREAVGWQMTGDPATGARIGIPTKLVGAPRAIESGSRWASKDGRVDIRTFSLAGQDLAQLFEKMKQETPGRKVTYSVLRADWFVISDTGAGRDSYTRFTRVADGARGFVVVHDPKLGPDFARVVIAIAGTFEPVAGEKPALASTPGAASGQVPTTPSPSAAQPAQPAAPIATGLLATGLVVAPGKVLSAGLGDCAAPTVAGKAASIDKANAGGGLALLSAAGLTPSGPLALADAAPPEGASVVVASVGPSLGATTGTLSARGLKTPLQRGGQGAIAIDASGRVVGMVTAKPDERRQVMGLIPEATYALAGVDALASAIEAAGGTVEKKPAGTSMASGAAFATVAPRVVAIGCK